MGKFKKGSLRLLDGSTFSFVSVTRQTAQLPVPAMFMKRLWLFLRGTLTISAVTVPGNVHTDGPVNLIQDVELLLDGYPIKKGLAAHFFRLSQKYDQTDGVNAGLFAASAGAQSFEALIPLYFEMPSALGMFDTIEDGRRIRNMVLNLTWGTTADIIVGNTSTLTISGCTVDVYVEETEPFALSGTPWRFRESEVVFPGITTNTGTRLLLPYNNQSVYRSLLLKTVDGSDLSDAIINSLDLRINGGQDIPFMNIEDDFFQAMSLYQFGLDTEPEGYYHIELAENGRLLSTGLGAGVPSNDINSVEIIANTTVGAGATSIIVHMAELVPPELVAKAG